MNTVIRKIGNSDGIIIPKEMLQQLGLKAGDEVAISVSSGGLLITLSEEEFRRQIAHADRFMSKYKVALKKLAE